MVSRETKIREVARAHGLDGLIGWRAEEMVMLTGYQPHWGLSVCWYPCEGRPVIYIPELEPRDRLPGGFEIKTFPWGLLDKPAPWDDLFAQLTADVGKRKAGWRQSSSHMAFPVHAAEAPPLPPDFLQRLPGIDATPAIHELLSLKTPSEIEKIRRANQIALRGLKKFFSELELSRTEAEVAAAVEASIHALSGKEGIHHARAWAFVQSGPNTAFAGRFNRSSGRVLQSGDLVTIELATCVDGYWSDLTRTGAVGKLSAEHQRIVETVKSAQRAALDVCRAGIKAGEVDAAARKVVEAAGLGKFFNHATGHAVGFRYHDPSPFLAPGQESILKEGMVLTIEPGIYGVELGGGCRIEDNVAVTTKGAEILSV